MRIDNKNRRIDIATAAMLKSNKTKSESNWKNLNRWQSSKNLFKFSRFFYFDDVVLIYYKVGCMSRSRLALDWRLFSQAHGARARWPGSAWIVAWSRSGTGRARDCSSAPSSRSSCRSQCKINQNFLGISRELAIHEFYVKKNFQAFLHAFKWG